MATSACHCRGAVAEPADVRTKVAVSAAAGEFVKVRDAATALVVRQRRQGRRRVLTPADVGDTHADERTSDDRYGAVFGVFTEAVFDSGWEVLMGQREIVNHLRSSGDDVRLMRYPGEFVFAGGAVDAGETTLDAARRELHEEFGLELPPTALSHLLSVRQTRPIRNTSNVIYNYVFAEEDNPAVQAFDVVAANERLRERRERFSESLASGSFHKLDAKAKEEIAPEVREIRWLDLADAVKYAYTSMNLIVSPVNDFQADGFAQHRVERRDPLFVTLLALLELEAFPSIASLAIQGGAVSRVTLYPSETPLEEVEAIYAGRGREAERCPRAEEFRRLRESRVKAAL
eukprot:TRINITY_DN41036_c0_g1_i1.p1 TRINITY_DN41036_c0_g1~~TRINITY_DN41036_c0_g1_i1.p1  ORF type:complete len:366 (-),score=68.77 TRINITY_DN41036_c0_g1_i1:127-1164(-)